MIRQLPLIALLAACSPSIAANPTDGPEPQGQLAPGLITPDASDPVNQPDLAPGVIPDAGVTNDAADSDPPDANNPDGDAANQLDAADGFDGFDGNEGFDAADGYNGYTADAADGYDGYTADAAVVSSSSNIACTLTYALEMPLQAPSCTSATAPPNETDNNVPLTYINSPYFGVIIESNALSTWNGGDTIFEGAHPFANFITNFGEVDRTGSTFTVPAFPTTTSTHGGFGTGGCFAATIACSGTATMTWPPPYPPPSTGPGAGSWPP